MDRTSTCFVARVTQPCVDPREMQAIRTTIEVALSLRRLQARDAALSPLALTVWPHRLERLVDRSTFGQVGQAAREVLPPDVVNRFNQSAAPLRFRTRTRPPGRGRAARASSGSAPRASSPSRR